MAAARQAPFPLLCLLAGGCTAILGIDKDYEQTSDGTAGSGGQGGTATTAGGGGAGATTSTTTATGAGGSTGTGGAGGGGALKADGVPCAEDGECQSVECTDGVCCDIPCGGVCVACAAALSGGADGVCTPIPAYEDPEDDCVASGATCNGEGLCKRDDGEPCTIPSQCVSNNCVGDVCVP